MLRVPLEMAEDVVPLSLSPWLNPTKLPVGILLMNALVPSLPLLTLALCNWLVYSALFFKTLHPSVPVLKRFLSAVAVLPITLPSSCVWLPTSIW
ncbi:hypothetical protein [Pseudomonas sp. 44 R 15]|nr:hypothetical protein [Pseudomonas sp. 44 R 15]CRM36614.1 hypothetical protein [Pseudomonas sp. 44 R 15]